jgi:hypothetical protein
MTAINTTILQVFPYKYLTKIDSDTHPLAMAICKLKNELYANAHSITTTLGSGNYGHLGLIMAPAEYLAMRPPYCAPTAALKDKIPAPEVFIMPAVPAPLFHANNTQAAAISLV